MTADHLLKFFNYLGDDPSTIEKLRKIIVGLAMSGKLLSSDDEAMDQKSLLKKLEATNHSLARQSLLRQPTPLSLVPLERLPRGFHKSENFVRLGDIARVEKGPTGIMKAQPGPFPLVVTAEGRASCDHFDFDGAAAIVPLVSSAGHGKASLQRLHYQEGKFALGSILAAVFPHAPNLISARFLFEYLTAFKDELLVSQMIGTANVSLSIGKISDVPVPLVPPAVQYKVDELMRLCDRLATARTKREAVRDRLAAASFASLNAPDPETFQADARFTLDALPALTTRADQIKALRRTIINLAMRGKLVPQDYNDEPAAKLCQRIAKEKANSTGRNRLLPNIEEAEKTFDVPANWHWARMGSIFSIRTGFAFKSSTYVKEGTLVFRVTNFDRSGTFDLSDVVFYPTEKIDSKMSGFLLEPGEIIMVMVGGTIGKTTIVDDSLLPALLNQNMWRIRSFGKFLPSKFEYLLVKDINQSIHGLTQSTHGHFAMSDYERRVFPLPPLAEQHRIVAKVDELMALCDRLEASLTATTATRIRLLEALLAEALEPAMVREFQAVE